MRIDKKTVFHTQALRISVHHTSKCVHIAVEMFCNRHAGVITGHHGNALNQLFHWHFGIDFNEHFGATGLPSLFTNVDLVGEFNFLVFECIKNHIKCQKFDERCRWYLKTCVMSEEDISGETVHQNGAFCLNSYFLWWKYRLWKRLWKRLLTRRALNCRM